MSMCSKYADTDCWLGTDDDSELGSMNGGSGTAVEMRRRK